GRIVGKASLRHKGELWRRGTWLRWRQKRQAWGREQFLPAADLEQAETEALQRVTILNRSHVGLDPRRGGPEPRGPQAEQDAPRALHSPLLYDRLVGPRLFHLKEDVR